jgi:hypothetical protein
MNNSIVNAFFYHLRWIMPKLTEYFEQFALISLEKQDKMDLLFGEHSYDLDLDAGKIRFNDNLDVTFQVLGTESDNTLIWLWAWADEQTEEVPVDLLKASRDLRDWGAHEGVPEFTLPAVDLHQADGHVLSMIACELCKASCYLRDAYEGGSAFLLLYDKLIDAQPIFDLSRLSRRFVDLISRYEINHRNVLLSYLRIRGLSLEEKGSAIISGLDSGERLSAEFDSAGRLTRLNGEAITT